MAFLIWNFSKDLKKKSETLPKAIKLIRNTALSNTRTFHLYIVNQKPTIATKHTYILCRKRSEEKKHYSLKKNNTFPILIFCGTVFNAHTN